MNTIFRPKEVYTSFLLLACPNGSYGQDCTLTCNDKCDGCNNVNGVCDRGCKPGWKGDNCEQRNVFNSYYDLISSRHAMLVPFE